MREHLSGPLFLSQHLNLILSVEEEIQALEWILGIKLGLKITFYQKKSKYVQPRFSAKTQEKPYPSGPYFCGPKPKLVVGLAPNP